MKEVVMLSHLLIVNDKEIYNLDFYQLLLLLEILPISLFWLPLIEN
jgi:hypothetical protein